MSKLHVALGYGDTREEAIKAAVTQYNEIEGTKVFHAQETGVEFEENPNNPDELKGVYITEVWFTLMEKSQQDSEPKFIGSEKLDPKDPNWREKWNQQNTNKVEPVSDGFTGTTIEIGTIKI